MPKDQGLKLSLPFLSSNIWFCMLQDAERVADLEGKVKDMEAETDAAMKALSRTAAATAAVRLSFA